MAVLLCYAMTIGKQLYRPIPRHLFGRGTIVIYIRWMENINIRAFKSADILLENFYYKNATRTAKERQQRLRKKN